MPWWTRNYSNHLKHTHYNIQWTCVSENDIFQACHSVGHCMWPGLLLFLTFYFTFFCARNRLIFFSWVSAKVLCRRFSWKMSLLFFSIPLPLLVAPPPSIPHLNTCMHALQNASAPSSSNWEKEGMMTASCCTLLPLTVCVTIQPNQPTPMC